VKQHTESESHQQKKNLKLKNAKNFISSFVYKKNEEKIARGDSFTTKPQVIEARLKVVYAFLADKIPLKVLKSNRNPNGLRSLLEDNRAALPMNGCYN